MQWSYIVRLPFMRLYYRLFSTFHYSVFLRPILVAILFCAFKEEYFGYMIQSKKQGCQFNNASIWKPEYEKMSNMRIPKLLILLKSMPVITRQKIQNMNNEWKERVQGVMKGKDLVNEWVVNLLIEFTCR